MAWTVRTDEESSQGRKGSDYIVSCESIFSFRSRRRSRAGSTKKQHSLHEQRSRLFRRKEVKVLFALGVQTTWGMLHLLRVVTGVESIPNSAC